MPIGIIFADWDSLHGPILKAKYMEKNIDFDIEYLNIFLLHTASGWKESEAQKQAFTQYTKYNLASMYIPKTEGNVLRRMLIAIILETYETKPNKYYEILQNINVDELLTTDIARIENYLKNIYENKIKKICQSFTIEEIKKMIPLKTGYFRNKITDKTISELKDKFGEWALDFLDHLPQNLEVEKLENLFQRTENEVATLIIWATEHGIIRLIG
ncbi:MAG: hypothetical protein EAX96_05925 [Candidatus Lokiarchaeota archaeon]|nr:hypothetical protein [Candidatus Lokiarchaeota archaeon]